MNTNTRIIGGTISAILSLGAAVSCSSDSSSSAGEANLTGGVEGVDNSTKFNDVNDAQAMDLCEAAESYLQGEFGKIDAEDLGCLLLSVFTSENKSACQTAYNDCKANPPADNEFGIDFSDVDLECGEVDSSDFECTGDITVGQLNTCMQGMANSLIDALDEITGAISCDLAGDMEALEAAGMEFENFDGPSPENIAACEAIDEACNLFDDDEG